MPTSFEALLIASLFVVPGYLGIIAFGLVRVRQRRDPATLLIEAVAASMALWLVFGPIGYFAFENSYHEQHPVRAAISVSLVALVVTPLVGWRLGLLVQSGKLGRLLAPRAWDHLFGRGEPLLVRVTLVDGSRVGGFWGAESCASVYPEPEDLYLEQVFDLDDCGRFGRPLDGSAGIWIPGRSIKLLEFLSFSEEPDAEDGHAQE